MNSRCVFCLPPQNLSECSCVSADSNFATAVPGKCPMPGCQEAFLIFLCVVCVCSLVGAMAQTPSVIILIRYSLACALGLILDPVGNERIHRNLCSPFRTVNPELKSYALGVLFLLLRLLGENMLANDTFGFYSAGLDSVA